MCSGGMSVQIILKMNGSSSTALMLICSYCSVILLAQQMEGAKDWLRWACEWLNEWMNEKYELFISQYTTVVRPWVRIYHCQKWIGIGTRKISINVRFVACIFDCISGYSAELYLDRLRLLSIFVNLQLITCRRTVTIFKAFSFIQQKPN